MAMSITELGSTLEQLGFDVGESPQFGGVEPVHTDGSMHYSGNALDINWPGGGEEEQQKLEQLWQALQGSGADELIYRDRGYFNGQRGQNWGDYGHPTHLHLGASGEMPVTSDQLSSAFGQEVSTADTGDVEHVDGVSVDVPEAGQVDLPAPEVEQDVDLPEVPDYPEEPLPLTADTIRQFAEQRRQATRGLQEAKLDRSHGRQQANADFRQFLNQLRTQGSRDQRELSRDAAERNLAGQPAFHGQGQRELRTDQTRQLGERQAQRTSTLADLDRAVNQARRNLGETTAAIERERARSNTDIGRLLGSQ